MERHCNTLLRSVKSRRHPYASIASFVTATAQLDQIRLFYNLHDELFLEEFGAEEVVDLKTVQCVVGRVKNRGEWSIVDRSDNVVA